MTRRAFYIIAGLVLAGLIALVFAFCRPKPTPIPLKEQFSRDSLTATQPGFQALVDTLRLIDSTATRQARQSAAAARSALRTADSLRQVAIAAQRAAETSGRSADSAGIIAGWKLTAASYRDEANQLRVANDSLDRAYRAESTAHRAAELRVNELGTRLLATSDLNTRLARDLQRASPPCRVLVVLGCPTRKVAFLGGVLAASAGAYVVTHRSQLKGVLP